MRSGGGRSPVAGEMQGADRPLQLLDRSRPVRAQQGEAVLPRLDARSEDPVAQLGRNSEEIRQPLLLLRGVAGNVGPVEQLDRSVAAGVDVHLLSCGLLDPAREAIADWVGEHPRFQHGSAPDHASWVAEVDRLLANNSLPGHADVLDFTASLTKVRDAVRAWCRTWAPSASPFTWPRSPRSLWGDEPALRERIGDSESDAESEATPRPADVEPSPLANPTCPARTPRLADRVVHLVRDSLAAGQYDAGQRVKEAPLAARLGVSRGPVREALRVLAEEGMLELLPNRGAAVPDVSATHEAARRWRVKVERSVRYMVAQLPNDHFDPDLWLTIAGTPKPRPRDAGNAPPR